MPMEESWAIRIGKAWASSPRAAVKNIGANCLTRQMAAAVDWQKRTILIWLNQQALRPDENPRLRGKTKMTKGLHAIETASRDEIVALQTERLKWTLNHVYDNVPHYQASFDAAGVHPDDFKSLDDLRKFPFTTKQDLRDNYPYRMFAVPRSEVVRIHASSGTTGKPTVVGYTQRDIATWADLIARSIYASGGRAGDIVHVAYGYGLFTGGLGAHYGAEKLGCTVIPMSGGQTEKQVQLICDFKPDIIMVTPSYMLNIADEFRRQGIDPKSTALRIGIHGAEPWTDAMRGEIESAFGIDAIDIYGLSEVIGPGVANECVESKDGPVIWEDHFYPEIIDPLTGEVLPEGSQGELVFTSLTKEAMPVIRYRTRDLTRLLPPTLAGNAADWQNYRSFGRYADHPWRECFPVTDRGTDPQASQAVAALRARSQSRRPPRFDEGQCRTQASVRIRQRSRKGVRGA
jgi:phenylacetate-CoA ligase